MNSSCLGVELLLESLDRTEVAFDGSLEGTCFQLASLGVRRGKILPEQRMVDMAYAKLYYRELKEETPLTSTVELECGLQSNVIFRGRGLGVRFLSRVQTVDIGLMVLFVVKSHDFLANVRLESLRDSWFHVRCFT